jgi:hypothetical protein
MDENVHKWELVEQQPADTNTGYAHWTYRMKVPSGWIYMHQTLQTRILGYKVEKAIVFVPDSPDRSLDAIGLA